MNITVDYSTESYMKLTGIINRCLESLAVLDPDDALRPNVECLLEMAETERTRISKEFPF